MTAPDDAAREKILSSLRAFHGGNIYLMGSRDLVAAGFEMHHEGEVSSIEWSKNSSCLHVRIGKAGRVVVNARLQDEKLVFSCTCSVKSAENGCVHVVCAILTLKNLLMPEVFKPRDPDPVYRQALLAGLTGSSRDKLSKRIAAGYSIVLEKKDGFAPDVYIAMDGERVTKLTDLLQSPLVGIAAADLHFHERIGALVTFLKQKGDKYPIIVRTGGEDGEAVFDPDLRIETFTELSLNNDEVSVIKGLRVDDKQSAPFVLFDELVYFPDSKKAARIENTGGWETWRLLRRELFEAGLEDDEASDEYSGRFSVPLIVYEKFDRGAGKRNKDILFTVKGTKTRPAFAKFEARLTLELPEQAGGSALLRPESVFNDFACPVNHSPCRFLEDLDFHGAKTGNRREALIRAFFELLKAETSARKKEILRTALDETETAKGGVRDEIRRLLLRHDSAGQENSSRVLVHEGEWRTVSHDPERETLLFMVPYEVFGAQIFDGTARDGAMRIPVELLYERLSLLCERLAGTGIAVYLRGKPVRQARAEFRIDATHKQNIDWFEIRPEIRCEGRPLDDASLDKLFAGRGLVERDEFIQIFDSNAHRILERIAAAYRAAEGRDKSGKIVRVPRLRILDWASLRKNGVAVQLPPEDEEIVERLLNFERIEPKTLPKGLLAKLRPYQREGYSWLAFLYEHRLGGCLADDMGLGKTLQAISLLGGIDEGIVHAPPGSGAFPHLIVVPPSLVFNWEQEIGRFYPRLKLHLYTGSERSADFENAGVVVTTYGTIRRDIDKLKDMRFHVIIYDEAQAVKNLNADTTGAVRRLNGLFKLTITGTPVENHLGEYYSIVDLAIPGLLGEYDRFRPLIKSAASADLDVIIARTRPFVLRRTKEAVLKDLPAKTETDIYLDLTEDQKALYQRTVEQVRASVDEAYRTKTQAQAKIIALTAILKLRQVCITPQLIDPELSGVSPKMDFLIEQLQELMDENHSALVFSQFTSFLDILGKELSRNGIGYLRLDGSTAAGKRKNLVKEFQEGTGPSVFLLSLKAGGQGLNLTKASYVFHLDPWWNPAVEDQASDRAHRIGQKNKVTVTRLLMRHTIEEKMMELKKRKGALYEAILQDGDGGLPGPLISKTDFEFLLG